MSENETTSPEDIIIDPDPSKDLYLSEQEKLAQAKESLDAMYWLDQVSTIAKQEAKAWFDECRSAWREFQGQKQDGLWRPTRLWYAEIYPRYWSDTELMQPALYSRTPKPVSRRKFDSPDLVARTATVINDRLASWLMSTSDFDRAMEMCALGFLNTNRQTARVFFEENKIEQKKKIYVTQAVGEDGMTPIYVDDTLAQIPDDVGVLFDEDGKPYYESETEVEYVIRPRITTKAVHFDKIRISPGARNESEIWWIAYQITVTKKQAAQLFGDKIKDIQVAMPDQGTQASDWDTDNRIKKSEDLFTYWEVWNKRDKEVYWLNESYKEGFLKKEKDIYDLIGFFPSPKFMMDNMRYDSMYPVPDYTQCKDSYEQLHILYKRINQTVRAIKAAILFDGNEADLVNFFREMSDNEGIGVSKWAETQTEGGFQSKIFIPDYSGLANVLNVLVAAFERQKLAVDELRGITDLIRGASDPSTSATAEKIKDRRSSLRFAKKKKAVLEFAVELLQMMLDLAYKTFSEDYISEIVGFAQMSPGDQQNFYAALALLRNDEERVIRIDIETDSMVLFDDMDRKEQAIEALNVIGGYVQNISQANPTLLPPLLVLLNQVVRSMDDAKDAEDPLNQAFNQLLQQANQPPQPPQPNPDVLAKIQADQSIRQMEVMSRERIEMAKLGLHSQVEGGKLQRKDIELQLKGAAVQNTTAKDQSDAMVKMGDLQLKGAALQQNSINKQGELALKADGNMIQREWMQLDAEGGVVDTQIRMNEQALKAQEVGLKSQFEAARIQIEQALASLKEYETVLSEREKMLTEERLQRESMQKSEIDSMNMIKELELGKTQEETKQVEAIAKAQEKPPVQVIIPSS